MKKYIIFDFDGTLADTNQLIIDSWQSIFMHYREEKCDEAALYHTFGETLRYSISHMLPEADTDEAVQLYRQYQTDHEEEKINLFPGCRELIEELKRRNITQAIVTSRTGKTTKAYLDEMEIGGYFDVVVTCDDVKEHKPDPMPLLKALKKLEAEKNEALMVGDTRFDMGCAANAGVDSVLAGWSKAFSDEDRKLWEPVYTIDEPADLLELI